MTSSASELNWKTSTVEFNGAEVDQTTVVPASGQLSETASVEAKSFRTLGRDIRIAREASDYFKSNITKLQIDEVLKQVKLPRTLEQSVNKYLFRLKDIFTCSTSVPFPDLKEVAPRLPPEVEITLTDFEYCSPQRVNIVGSHSTQTHVSRVGSSGIDLVVIMPKQLIYGKDRKDFVYVQKRALYLAGLSKTITKSSLGNNVVQSYMYLHDNRLRPVLRLEFKDKKLSQSLHVVVHVGVDPECFSAHKLEAGRSNLSGRQFSPLYNHAILCDMAYEWLLQYIHSAMSECKAFSDSVVLARLWLRQRGFTSSPLRGGFGPFEMTILQAALLKGKPAGSPFLLNGYSSYQLFRGLLLYLAEHDLNLLMKEDTTTTYRGSSQTPFLVFEPLGINILERMPLHSVRLLQHQARMTLDMLNDPANDRFAQIFLRNCGPIPLQFDTYFFVDIDLDDCFDRQETAIRKIYNVLDRGLVPRIHAMSISGDSWEPWPILSNPGITNTRHFTVALLLDSAHAEKRVTLGPSNEEKNKIADFQEYWGNVASLRRFQDGTIRQAVVWPVTSQPLCMEIAKYILTSHLNATLSYPSHYNEILTFLKDSSPTDLTPFMKKYQSFSAMGGVICDVTGCPLRILGVHGTSSSLRYTSVDHPKPYSVAVSDAVATGVIEVEGSSNWPGELIAFEQTKIAILLKISELLQEQFPKYRAAVGLKPDKTGFLLVMTPEGYYFDLTIMTKLDESVYSRAVTEGNLNERRLLQLQRETTHGVNHNRLISLMAVRHRYFSPTTRLLKLWFRKQLLGMHIHEQAVELLVLKVFLDSSPYEPPASIFTAFLRVIHFIGSWDWSNCPIILDVDRSNEVDEHRVYSNIQGINMDPRLYQNLNSFFAIHRAEDPAYTLAPWFIGNKMDLSGIMWTQVLPRSDIPRIVAKRVKALATAGAQLLIASDTQTAMIFRPSLSDYDVLIKVKIPRERDEFKNIALGDPRLVARRASNQGRAIFDRLRDIYKDCLLLFYSGSYDDKHDYQIIAGVWIENVLKPQKFSPKITYPVKLEDNGYVRIDKDAICTEIMRIGSGFLEWIEK